MASHEIAVFPQHMAIDSLALAMTTSSNTPLLLLDGELSVLAASNSFCAAFELDAAQVRGRSVSELGNGEWRLPQVATLLGATASGHTGMDAYEVDLSREGREPRNLVLNARRLDYGEGLDVRLLLAVTDVTETRANARLKENLLYEKALLLHELNHRVANSLQIIASILMQSARRVQSDEARGYLRDAHNRVMSIAELQRHLTDASMGSVVLRTYLTDLCHSLGASMIEERRRISLEVATDDTEMESHESVSIGLIVTELVINALKYAFPDGRAGAISVAYRAEGADWMLTVRDDGVGIPAGAGAPKPGLGTSIVEALANQLGATIDIATANPGTIVSIVHRSNLPLPSGGSHANQH